MAGQGLTQQLTQVRRWGVDVLGWGGWPAPSANQVDYGLCGPVRAEGGPRAAATHRRGDPVSHGHTVVSSSARGPAPPPPTPVQRFGVAVTAAPSGSPS